MDRWKCFIDWCQRPSMIKTRTFNPKNITVVAFSIILISLVTLGTWRYQVTNVPKITFITPEDIETLTITTDTTLTEDHFGNIVIDADNVTLDGNGYMIIGPGSDTWICDPNTGHFSLSTGILLEGRTGVTVKNCHVIGFQDGFFLYDSDGNTLKGNTAKDNAFIGFILSSSSNNTLLNNTANHNGDPDGTGFALEMSFGNTLTGNTAKDNFQGFTLEETSGNIFEANTAKDNSHSGFTVGFSSNNTFFHNNLINNTIQATGTPEYANTWDDGYPSGGNYWSDYKGADTNGDGIGDTPYVIDENNMDRFPRMAPISVFDAGTKGGEKN